MPIKVTTLGAKRPDVEKSRVKRLIAKHSVAGDKLPVIMHAGTPKINAQTHATGLLTNGEAPVSEVAKSVGFKDALYFSKAFHRRYGLSPTEYREKHKGDQGWYSRFYVT